MFEYGARASSSIELVDFPWPINDLWPCRAHEHWQRDVGFGKRRRVPSGGVGFFDGCHNVEIFALPPADLVSLYVPLPAWCGEYEVWWVLCVPSPTIFAYYSFYILRGLLLK